MYIKYPLWNLFIWIWEVTQCLIPHSTTRSLLFQAYSDDSDGSWTPAPRMSVAKKTCMVGGHVETPSSLNTSGSLRRSRAWPKWSAHGTPSSCGKNLASEKLPSLIATTMITPRVKRWVSCSVWWLELSFCLNSNRILDIDAAFQVSL